MAIISSFSEFKLNKQLLTAIGDVGYSSPTEIQVKSIPAILGGNDLVGIAQTGTGKTAAYLLPLLMKLKYAQGSDPRGLVLAPTRELAIQIKSHCDQFAANTDLRVAALYGGTGMKPQIAQVEPGVDLIIATPGRFWDVYKSGAFASKQIKTVVLDEADRMMDMGFMPQLRKILELLPMKRQNLLFSATFPDKVRSLSQEFLDYPVRVEVTPQATTAETIKQVLYEVPNFKTKLNMLQHLLLDDHVQKAILFVKTKDTANNLWKFLSRKQVGEARVIHSNKDQNSRLKAIRDFTEDEVRILVTTDVSARGLDISMVTHVINFDVPVLYEDYVHRVGRTGRAKQEGTAITFATPAEVYHTRKIEELINLKIPTELMPKSVEVTETGYDEKQEMAREIDSQRKKEDPTFQGAFHEKKKKQQGRKKRR